MLLRNDAKITTGLELEYLKLDIGLCVLVCVVEVACLDSYLERAIDWVLARADFLSSGLTFVVEDSTFSGVVQFLLLGDHARIAADFEFEVGKRQVRFGIFVRVAEMTSL